MIEYRLAEKTDLPELLALYRQLNPEEEPIDLEKACLIWEAAENSNTTRYFVAIEDGRIVSTCNISLLSNLTRSGRPFAIIENVVTDSNYRRRGIGRIVMQNAVRYAKEHNCYKVMLLSSARRTESHRFYESLGFDGSSKRGFEMRFCRLSHQ